MRILVDTNIILDFFLEREPFFQAANDLFEAIADRRIEGFSQPLVLPIFFTFVEDRLKALILQGIFLRKRFHC